MDGTFTYWLDGKPIILDDYGALSNWAYGEPFCHYEIAVTTKTTALDADVLLKQLGIASSLDVDMLLQGTVLSNADLDVLLRGRITRDFNLDVLLRVTDSLNIAIDAIMVEFGIEDFNLDALLQTTDSLNMAIDVFLKDVDIAATRSVAIDALVRAIITNDIIIDIILAEHRTSVFSVDGMLQGSVMDAFGIDTILFRPHWITGDLMFGDRELSMYLTGNLV